MTTSLPPLTHGTAELAPDVRLHHVTTAAGDSPLTVVLIHGYPQHWWQWRHVIGPLAAAGFRVVAVDYRGAGHSSKPTTGYDKRTMASDLRTVVREHLSIRGPLAVVGHDIGSMVAYAFALQFPDDVSHLSLSEAPLPGTTTYDGLLVNPQLSADPLWHFRFHNATNNLAETLTAGRERIYLDHFFDRLAFHPEAVDAEARSRYAEAFAGAGRCGPASSFTGPLTGTRPTTASRSRPRAGCGCRCWRWRASTARWPRPPSR